MYFFGWLYHLPLALHFFFFFFALVDLQKKMFPLFMCTHLHVHVEARGQHQVFLYCFYLLFCYN